MASFLKISEFSEDPRLKILKMGKTLFGKLLYPCYAFYFDGILIDTGPIVAQDKFIKFLDKYPPKAVLITHADEDHIGNLRYIQDHYDIPTYAHENAKEWLEDISKLELLRYQKWVWGIPKPGTSQRIQLETPVNIGNHTVIALSTPGHRDHHLSYYFPEQKWVFTGDIYCGTFVQMFFKYEKFDQILNSNKKLNALNVETIFCGFKGVVPQAKQKLAKKIENLETLKSKVFDLYDKGLNIDQITKKILGKETIIAKITEKDLTKKNMIEKILELKNTST
jgi:ribonuclease/clavin/mitogillin